MKNYFWWKESFTEYALEIRLPDSSKLAINQQNGNDVTTYRNDLIAKFFWRCFVPLAKFSYWSKFHVNIITGSGAMTIFFYKGLTRNLEIGIVWVLTNICILGRVRSTKFGTNISNVMLMNAAKCYVCRFYSFWVIKSKPTEG